MGGVPGSKVVQFDMGNLTEDFPVQLTLVAEEACQIRGSALESARITANRFLLREVGRLDFRLKLRVYPHQVLRENKQATGAGADRVSDGMRNSFGKTVGTAARVKAGQKIMTLGINPQHFLKAKSALARAGKKLPTPYRIVIERDAKQVS